MWHSRMMNLALVVVVGMLASTFCGALFVPPALVQKHTQYGPFKKMVRPLNVAASMPLNGDDDDTIPNLDKSFVMSNDEIKPIITIGKKPKEKIINAYGLWCLIVSLTTMPIWFLALNVMRPFYAWRKSWDPTRSLYDGVGKIWAKVWLWCNGCYPTFSGNRDLLKQDKGACLYVANHSSMLDIPVVCTVLDPVFKFISKAEMAKAPCIGDQLKGGKHILIDRNDRRSQLRTFREGVGWLQRGVPLMAFPEGRRSKTGRLMDFKGGVFSMAVREKVPIVPLSISNAHAIMPGNSLLPVQRGRGKLHVHIHDPIETKNGLTEEELSKRVKEALLSKLPKDQHPIEKEKEEANESQEVS